MAPTIIDVRYRDGIRWEPLAERRKEAQQLLRAFERQATKHIQPFWQAALKRAIAVLNGLLGSHYREEVDALADALDVDTVDLLAANLVYDLSHAGCSTFVTDSTVGPLHARNLDWDFPRGLLRKHTTIVRVKGAPCGPYTMVTWPGLFGALTAVAPGRFSVTVNTVVGAETSTWQGVVRRGLAGHWPVPWVVRRALDQCRTFNSAVACLRSESLIAPVLFTVAGTQRGEAAVIERSPDEYIIRRPTRGTVAVTNHYRSKEFQDSHDDLDGFDTVERGDRLDDLLGATKGLTPASALKVLASSGVLRPDTAHQVAMMPGTGEMLVRIPGGRAVSVPPV